MRTIATVCTILCCLFGPTAVQAARRPVSLQLKSYVFLYTIFLFHAYHSSQHDFLNNKYLGQEARPSTGNEQRVDRPVGLYPKRSDSLSEADYFDTYISDPPPTSALERCNDNNRLALIGKNNGILDLVLADYPNTQVIPPGKLMEWDTFKIAGDGQMSVSDGSILSTRRWVAYDGGNGVYLLALYDGKNILCSH